MNINISDFEPFIEQVKQELHNKLDNYIEQKIFNYKEYENNMKIFMNLPFIIKLKNENIKLKNRIKELEEQFSIYDNIQLEIKENIFNSTNFTENSDDYTNNKNIKLVNLNNFDNKNNYECDIKLNNNDDVSDSDPESLTSDDNSENITINTNNTIWKYENNKEKDNNDSFECNSDKENEKKIDEKVEDEEEQEDEKVEEQEDEKEEEEEDEEVEEDEEEDEEEEEEEEQEDEKVEEQEDEKVEEQEDEEEEDEEVEEDEEEDEEEEEEEELYEFTYRKKTYYCTDEKLVSGYLYEILKDGEPGKEVGYISNKKVVLNKK
jgi:hypothetical protein